MCHSRKSAFLFDNDGVISNSIITLHWWFIQIVCREITFKQWSNLSNGNYWEELNKSPYKETLLAAEYHPMFPEYIKKHATTPAFDGALELLNELKQKAKIGINTSGFKENVENFFLHKNFDPNIFDFMGTKETCVSKEEKIFLFSDEANIPINKMVFIFDTVGDGIEVEHLKKNFGLTTVGVTYGLHTRKHLYKYSQPTHMVNTVGELRTLLTQFIP